MSGGWYDYFFAKTVGTEVSIESAIEALHKMRDKMIGFGHPDIAALFQAYAFECQRFVIVRDTYHRQLNNLMHALEWQASGDSDVDHVHEEVKKYKASITVRM